MAQGKNEVSPVDRSSWPGAIYGSLSGDFIAGVQQPPKTRFSPGAFAKSSKAFKFALVRREKRGFSRLMFTRPLKKVKALLKNWRPLCPGKRDFTRCKELPASHIPLAPYLQTYRRCATTAEKRGFPRALLQSPQKLSNLLWLGREKRGFSRLTFTRPLKNVKALLKNVAATRGPGKNEVSPAEKAANDQKTKLPARRLRLLRLDQAPFQIWEPVLFSPYTVVIIW